MQPASTPRPRDDQTAHDHLRANIQAAAPGGTEAGHWRLHYIALPAGAPSDFTPYRAPDYAEQEFGVHEPLLEWLSSLLTVDHAAAVAQRGLEAGQ